MRMPKRYCNVAVMPSEERRFIPPAIAGLIAAGVYLRTLAPTITYGDSPELAGAAVTLGIPHPSGYPLYMLLGHAWSRLFPFGDPGWRLNLLSALLGAAAVALMTALFQRVCRSWPGSIFGALVFAFSPFFWDQCLVTEVYALHVLLQSAILYFWLRWREGGRFADLALLAGCFGLGFTHHLMTVLLVPLLLFPMANPQLRAAPRRILLLLVLGAAPLLLYLYLPLVSSGLPAFNWGKPDNLNRFLLHVTGAQYHGFLKMTPHQSIGHLAAGEFQLLFDQLGPAPLLLSLLGAGTLVRRPRLRLPLISVLILALVFALGYRVADPEPFHLPALQILALLAGLGAAGLLAFVASRHHGLGRVLALLLPLLPLGVMAARFPRHDLSGAFTPHDSAVAALAAVPRGAALFTTGMEGYVPFYARYAAGLRPDLAVVDPELIVLGRYDGELERLRGRQMPPDVNTEVLVGRTLAAMEDGRRPLAIIPQADDMEWKQMGLFRLRGGVIDPLLRAAPDLRIPAGTAGVPSEGGALFGRKFRLLRLDVPRGELGSGDLFNLEFFWRTEAEGGLDSSEVVVVIADSKGEIARLPGGVPLLWSTHPLGQGTDIGGFPPGTLLREELILQVPRHLPSGVWSVWVGVRREGVWLAGEGDRVFFPGAEIHTVRRPWPLWTLPRSSGRALSFRG